MKEITLELTNVCNNECLHCSSLASPHNCQELSLYRIDEILNKYNPEWVNLSGGEPLLYSSIEFVTKHIHSKGIKMKLYTSGYCGNFINTLDMISKYIDTIVFPFYSNRKNIFEFITGKNSFYNSIINMKHAISIGMNVEIHIVPMTVNLYTLDDTIKELISLGISKINILKLVNQGRCSINSYLIPDNRILLEELQRLNSKYESIIKLGLPLSHGRCTAGNEKLVAMCNGNIIPCESYKDGICKCERLFIE